MNLIADQEIHLRDYLYVLRKRRTVMVLFFMAAIAGAIFFTMVEKVVYKATATIVIERENPNVVDFKEVMAYDGTASDYYQTQYQMLKSRTLIADLIEREKLDEDPFVASNKKGIIHQLIEKQPFLSRWLSDFMVKPSLEDIVIKKMLRVEPIRNSRLVQVSMIHPDPQRAAELATSIVQLFIRRNLEDRFMISNQASGLISKQILELKDKVGDAERKLQKYKEENNLINIPSMHEKDTFLQEAKLELVKIQAEEAKLAKRYLPKHPARIHIRSQIEGLQEKIEEEEQKNIGLSRKAIDYGEYEREAESSRQIYESLLKRLQETSSEAQTQASNVLIVDKAAVPPRPYRPKPLLNLLIGGALGIFGGILLAFFNEYLDSTIKIPDDIEKGLGLDLFGVIPEGSRGEGPDGSFFVTSSQHSPTAESFRAIRTALLFRLRHVPSCRIFLITSPNPSEGKTTVCLNLAKAFQQNHLKVLLIDGDLRKPKLHRLLSAPRQPGIKEVLDREAPAAQAIQQNIAGLGFDFLGSGEQSDQPAEVLGSRRMQSVMDELRSKYDIILIDSSPYLAVADATILSEYAECLVVVARHQQTDKRHLEDLKKRFSLSPTKHVGAIINRVSVREKDYYYHQYYYYGYGEKKP